MLQDHAVKYLTRDEWLKVVSEHRQYQLPSSHSRARRQRTRARMIGWATLTIESTGAGRQEVVYSRCPILDASGDGLAVRSSRSIVPGTMLSIELYTTGKHACLRGRVANCSMLPGFARVGVTLEFPAPDGEH